jgi:hypothetical protein
MGIDGVPEASRGDDRRCERYLRETCITKDEHAKRSWKWASLLVRIARGRDGQILCVIVVEREDGGPIKLARELELTEKKGSSTSTAHDLCTWELQLAAELWAALKDDA